MASIVARRDGRFEIRESLHTSRGPRSRTLAIFRNLTPEKLDQAVRRAVRPVDPDALRARARVMGIAVVETHPARAARSLLLELRSGRTVPPALAALLHDALACLPRAAPPESVGRVTALLGASEIERGRAVRERLGEWAAQIALLASRLAEKDLAHAFGGSIALAYYGALERMSSIALHAFVRHEERSQVLRCAGEAAPGIHTVARALHLPGVDRVRIAWDGSFLELLFGRSPIHDAAASRARPVAFGRDRIRVLSAEDVVAYEVAALAVEADAASWGAVEQVLFDRAETFDVDYVREGLARLLPRADPRLRGFDERAAGLLGR